MAWTEQMVEDLKKMWHEGLTTGEIGKRLGVSKNSIVGKVHRLQLSGRPSPIKKKDEIFEEKAAPAKPAKEEKAAPVKAKEENFHFCGKKVKIGQTYCEEHANIAYVKAGKK